MVPTSRQISRLDFIGINSAILDGLRGLGNVGVAESGIMHEHHLVTTIP